MSPATPANALLTASKIVMMLQLLAAGPRFADGVSVCSPDVLGGQVTIGGDITADYMCLDHTLGSDRMVTAQNQFNADNDETVHFGIGSFGPQSAGNMGKCYKMYLDGVDTIVVGQVTNFGGDIGSRQFDMQMGGGGFGVFNACGSNADYTTTAQGNNVQDDTPCDASQGLTDIPALALYEGQGDWGQRCGGQTTLGGCDSLPVWPSALYDEFGNLQGVPAEKDLQKLCRYAFDNNVRRTSPDGDANHDINTIVRIPCPGELIAITQLQREDDLPGDSGVPKFEEQFGAERYFLTDARALGEEQFLTSTMDCCASAATDPSNTSDGTGIAFVSNMNALPVCDSTGY